MSHESVVEQRSGESKEAVVVADSSVGVANIVPSLKTFADRESTANEVARMRRFITAHQDDFRARAQYVVNELLAMGFESDAHAIVAAVNAAVGNVKGKIVDVERVIAERFEKK